MSSPATAVTGATVLAGGELTPLSDATLVIEGDHIVALGAGDEVAVPEGARTVDGRGLTLLPGFIDAHVHIGFVDPLEVAARGVTTVRDLGWPPQRIWPLVEESKARSFGGPTVVAAGQMLTAARGYPMRAAWAPPGTGRVVRGADEAAAAVEEQAEHGARIIKIALNPPVGPVLGPPALAAVIDAAHDRGLGVTGHVYGLAELDKALDAGIDELSHMLMSPESIPEKMIGRMVRSGVTIVPTLAVRSGSDRAIAIDNLARFSRAGGRVIYGTDLGNAGPRPGIDQLEVTAMAEAGMSARHIIASATVRSAAYLELEDRGILAEGMRADIVAVRGDPLGDLDSLMDVVAVWRAGRRVPEANASRGP